MFRNLTSVDNLTISERFARLFFFSINFIISNLALNLLYSFLVIFRLPINQTTIVNLNIFISACIMLIYIFSFADITDHDITDKELTFWKLLGNISILVAASLIGSITSTFLFNLLKIGNVTSINQSIVNSHYKVSWLYFLNVIFIAPVVEEYCFRGALYNFIPGYEWVKIIITSLVFALLHISNYSLLSEWLNFPIYLFPSIALTLIYHRRHSVNDCITAHITYNLITCLIQFVI